MTLTRQEITAACAGKFPAPLMESLLIELSGNKSYISRAQAESRAEDLRLMIPKVPVAWILGLMSAGDEKNFCNFTPAEELWRGTRHLSNADLQVIFSCYLGATQMGGKKVVLLSGLAPPYAVESFIKLPAKQIDLLLNELDNLQYDNIGKNRGLLFAIGSLFGEQTDKGPTAKRILERAKQLDKHYGRPGEAAEVQLRNPVEQTNSNSGG